MRIQPQDCSYGDQNQSRSYFLLWYTTHIKSKRLNKYPNIVNELQKIERNEAITFVFYKYPFCQKKGDSKESNDRLDDAETLRIWGISHTTFP